MAKCVRIVGQGVPVRYTDEEAFQLVERDGDGEYCSKGSWRKWYVGRELAPSVEFVPECSQKLVRLQRARR